jgi:carbon monoxide dehydrogenase subunit G
MNKNFSINAHPDKVWNFLMDTKNLAECIPGCEEVEEISSNVYNALITMQIAFMKLRFKVNVKVTEIEAPTFLRFSVEGVPLGLVGQIKLDASLKLSEVNQVTEVYYEMRFAGKLDSLDQPVFRSKAKDIGSEFVKNICTRLEGK